MLYFAKHHLKPLFPQQDGNGEAMLHRNVDDQFRNFKICERDGNNKLCTFAYLIFIVWLFIIGVFLYIMK